MIDVKRYLEKKEKGLVALTKLGNAYVASWDRFDPETGEKLEPVVEAVSLDNMNKIRKEASDLLKGIDGFITDLGSLKSA